MGANAKLVDLDVNFQAASEIYGWSIEVDNFFKGDFERVGFKYMWSKMKDGKGMSKFGAVYQSVLTNVQFGSKCGDSSIAKCLQGNLGQKRRLSIRINVDMYDSDSTSNNFTHGRIVGSIGISGDRSPPYFTFGRLLKPVTHDPNFWFSPFLFDKASCNVFVDLGNSLGIKKDGSIVDSIGQLKLGLLAKGDKTQAPECDNVKTWFPQRMPDANAFGGYMFTSGIFHANLKSCPKIQTLLLDQRLVLAQVNTINIIYRPEPRRIR